MMKNNVLFLVVGLPGTGKSYFAQRIAEKTRAKILRTDEIRKELAGMKGNEHRYEDFGEGLYAGEMTKKTYAEMYKRAKDILTRGDSVILDATFSRRAQREDACKIAGELDIHCLIVECVCPEEIVRERMRERSKDKGAVSDATIEIYQKMKGVFEPMGGDEIHVTVDTSGDLDENLGLVMGEIGK